MIKVAPISTRNQFGPLLTRWGLLGDAVEIGTHRGEYAAIFRSSWEGRALHCVDPWGVPPGYEEQARTLDGGNGDRELDYQVARRKVPGNTHFIRLTSKQAVTKFADGILDFVYIDGDHTQPEEDIALWWPKLRSGGLLAGHDIVCTGHEDWGRYIQPAVFQHAEQYAVDVFLVVEEGGLPWSFFMVKR